MIKKIQKKLKEKKGMSEYISFIVIFIVIVSIIALCFDYISPFVKGINVNTFAKEVVREVEIYGNIGQEVNNRIDELRNTLSINPNVTFNKQGRLNLNEEFEVTVKYLYKTPFFKKKINFTKTLKGKSEVYRK